MHLECPYFSQQGRNLVTMKDTAKHLGISVITLRKILREGRTCLLGIHKPTPSGRFVGVTVESIQQYVEQLGGREDA